MTRFGENEPPAGTDCRTTVPAGWLLFTETSFSLTLLAAAHCSATVFCWPTKLGTGWPLLTTSVTGLLTGQDAPAAGLVLITIPAWMVVDAWLTTLPGTSPAWRSALCASCSEFPVTCGTVASCAPFETIRVTTAPLLTRDPMAGEVLMMLPLATESLNCGVPIVVLNPALCRACWAVAAVSRATRGTVVYLPAAWYQTSTPISTT